MVKINWKVTDNIYNITKEEFDVELNDLYGYFEIQINGKDIGFCPQRELFEDEEGVEAIVYWISHLLESIIELKEKKKYEFALLSMNLRRLVFELKEGNCIEVCFFDIEQERNEWKETIIFNEYKVKILESAYKFLAFIKENNKELLSTNMIRKVEYLYFRCNMGKD